MLAVAFVHPSGRVEALVGLTCACATVATGLLTSAEVRAAVTDLAPVVAFLVTILVVSDICARDGVVTASLSLDATVVLLTPVVLAACLARSVPAEPGTYACLRMANSASLLLPVSNLTNLLAMPALA